MKNWQLGDEIHMTIRGVTNNRTYHSSGEIIRIEGNLAKVQFRQPWARWWNCMRTNWVDLRNCSKIKRRIPR